MYINLNHIITTLKSFNKERCGGRSFAEAWTSNMVDWKFCSNSISEINLTLLEYEILEKMVTCINFVRVKSCIIQAPRTLKGERDSQQVFKT